MTSSSPAPGPLQLCYENVNGSCVKAPYSPVSRILLYALCGFGAVLAVFENLLVMVSIVHFKQLHSPTNFLIASLACADFLVGVTIMPFSMVRSVESCWYFGKSFCTFHTCCDVAFCYSSLFHLCFISIDRYIAVTDPLVYPTKVTVPVSGLCISMSWVLALVYSGAVFYTGACDDGLEELTNALDCVGSCQPVINPFWILIDFLLFLAPTFLMMVLYTHTWKEEEDEEDEKDEEKRKMKRMRIEVMRNDIAADAKGKPDAAKKGVVKAEKSKKKQEEEEDEKDEEDEEGDEEDEDDDE
ncbi:Trace amine-associated receptor 6 [Tupaia chinensis]|uniref:Trace amine-associated receptor 6 n=1 Tax=Tupaia chinensis TaxID=246437 RepID=L9L3V4_TUPCH|nr:Trace amine-associated receptor 6 [Tupaia chinensis]